MLASLKGSKSLVFLFPFVLKSHCVNVKAAFFTFEADVWGQETYVHYVKTVLEAQTT